jgi:ABC-type transporter Mla MlaB component
MIRIMKSSNPNRITITVDGDVAGEDADAIETVVNQASGRGSPIHLFLRDVFRIDQHGFAVLCRVAAAGVRLSATGVYFSHVVAKISRSAA